MRCDNRRCVRWGRKAVVEEREVTHGVAVVDTYACTYCGHIMWREGR